LEMIHLGQRKKKFGSVGQTPLVELMHVKSLFEGEVGKHHTRTKVASGPGVLIGSKWNKQGKLAKEIS